MKNVYMDHASATPVKKSVIEAMLPYFDEYFGNPSTVYDMGSKIKETIEEQRAKVANLIGAKPTQIKQTGHPEKRLSGHASFCIAAIEGEALIFMLNAEGICVNTGSACASKALKTSPVLVAIGVPPDLAQGSIVFTLNNRNKVDEVEYVLEKLSFAVEKLRSLSPIWREQKAA